ncbi:ATP-binding cassette domain-containing protein [Nonomuraea sp. SBT364]|uniref:ATP-binding cassette domain-containing protein n=1 Tax=Nonomuraea sp. SBT364 TaxID=1580530 RepID=UPI000AE704F2
MADLPHRPKAAAELASSYSGGMRRKLNLAVTLVGEPQIVFLDELTTGLAPTSSPTASRSSIRAGWSPRAPPTSSSAGSPAATSGCGAWWPSRPSSRSGS